MRTAAVRLQTAPRDKVHYVLVKVPIEGDQTSAVSSIVVREFDLGP
jgi:hypothetical protein